MKILWTQNAWNDYQYFQYNDYKTFLKINKLVDDISTRPFNGIGKPEPLHHNLKGNWSRRITREHRLIYKLINNYILIVSCRFHYE